MGEFDPFLDYSSLTDEMVTDMAGVLRESEAAKQELMVQPSPQALERTLKAYEAIEDTVGAIQQSIWRVPVIVHVAGEIEDEESDEFGEIKLQRCVRCKSQLAGWRPNLIALHADGSTHELAPDEVMWHEVGEVLAKSASEKSPLLYTIKGRELEAFERECVGLPNMEDPNQ